MNIKQQALDIKQAIEENRRGRFRISKILLLSYPDKLVRTVFSEVLVTGIEYGFGWDIIIYEGYSMNFEVCLQELVSPEYIIELNTKEDGIEVIKWLRL